MDDFLHENIKNRNFFGFYENYQNLKKKILYDVKINSGANYIKIILIKLIC